MYSRQKQSLKEELENFLHALPGRKTIFDAIPFDVCCFLVYRDAMGKTQPHRNECPHTGHTARFPDDSGLLFNHVWGKTLRDAYMAPQICSECVVIQIRQYARFGLLKCMSLCQERLALTFPGVTDQKGRIVDQPLTSSTAESRLKLYLRQANIDAGETLHSFRSGCALTLTFSGSNLADIMSHVGWSSPSTAQYYLKLSSVIRARAPADLLSKEYSQSCHASALYEELNYLKNFISAFPSRQSPSYG